MFVGTYPYSESRELISIVVGTHSSVQKVRKFYPCSECSKLALMMVGTHKLSTTSMHSSRMHTGCLLIPYPVVSGEGLVCLVGYLPRGMCIPACKGADTHREQNDWQTGVKTLSFPKLHLRAVTNVTTQQIWPMQPIGINGPGDTPIGTKRSPCSECRNWV